ncbi:MAG: hypothetical protein ACPG6V_04705 [Flavobacteriales bacterium]
MPYDRNTQLKPSSKMLNLWLELPKTLKLEIEELKTSARFTEIHPIIYLFIFLTSMAIFFDFYLGLTVLTKAGISISFVVLVVLADIFLAVVGIFPFFNSSNIKHQIFKNKIEIRTRKKILKENGLEEELDKEFESKRFPLEAENRGLKKKLIQKKIAKTLVISLIFGVAFWKIYQYYSILPQGLNIWAIPKGKMVIIMALLTAIFHALATETTLQYFRFISRRNKDLKLRLEEIRNNQNIHLEPNHLGVPYVGHYTAYKCKKTDSTELIINENGQAQINYVNIIWDDEILELINHQQDQNAKNGIMLTFLNTKF